MSDDSRPIAVKGGPPITPSAIQQLDEYNYNKLQRAAGEIARRDTEALRVYRPSSIQEQFHSCRAKECVFVAGNQVGKSVAGYVEDARAVLGGDPHKKYPKENGIAAIVVYKESQIKLNTYRYLLKPGAFDIIRDVETGMWKPYYPWVPEDRERKHEKRPAPPLIPRRMIKNIAWKSKTGNVFTRIDLETGWELHVFSSTAKPDAGFQADLVHIDEDIANEEWYTEMIARLSIREGLLRWTALPLFDNDVLPRIVERGDDEKAKHERGGPTPTTTVVRATIFDNPYLTEETRQENIKRWSDQGEDVVRQRAYGELITDTVRMYPTFSPEVHSVDVYKDTHPALLGEYCRTRQIPNDWCLRLFVDPGFSTCAAILVATVPNESIHIVVNEIYLQQATPRDFAAAASKMLNGRWLQSMVMDAHGGRLTSIASGQRPQEAYENAMAAQQIRSIETGTRFKAGCDATEYRETELRLRLTIQPDLGIPAILYDPRTCPNLEREMIRLRKSRHGGVVSDKRATRQSDHAVDALEYAAAESLTYFAPPKSRTTETPGERRARRFHERKARRRLSASQSGGNLNGGIVLSAGSQ